MPIPSAMADLSTTANSNSPAGTESPSNADDFLRAIQAIVRTTNAKGADIASATTTDIGAATGEFVDVTGTTTITSLGTVAAGIVRTVRFTGALTLTHNATSLILPGSANITTANGDVAQFRSLGSGNWKCVGYIKQDGTSIVNTLSSTTNKYLNTIQDFRLSLTTAVPVTTSDVTGATSIYAVPYAGNSIALFDGTNWNIRTSNEFSLALGTILDATNYDVFCYDNAGTPTLEFTAWTNATTRATALTYQDGILSKTGALTRRYLGTFRTTATTTTEDSAAKRFLWNYYHRKERQLLRRETTASWTYTTATLRQANNSTANQIDFLIGVQEDAVKATLDGLAGNVNNITFAVAMGLDGIASIIGQGGHDNNNASPPGPVTHLNANYVGYPGVGRHYITWCETSAATGTTTWYGNLTQNGVQNYSGLSGVLMG